MTEDVSVNGIEIPENIKVKSLYKAIQLLFYFTETDRELGVTELAQKSGLLKSSVFNMLSTYEACGLVHKNPETDKYHLGIRVLELSNQFYMNNDIRSIMLPHMMEIANIVNESVFLAVINGTELIYLDGAFPTYSTLRRNMAGVKAPIYCTGIGKALLAYRPDLFGAVTAGKMIPFTQSTLTTAEALQKDLDLIRERGYAIDNMEHEFGVRCVAVPIFNSAGEVIAAFSVSGPSPRLDDEKIQEYASLLKQHAQQVKPRFLPGRS